MSTDKNNRITETDIRGLEHRLEELIRTCQRLKEENRLLRQQQTALVSARAKLQHKNDLARAQTEMMLLRLKALVCVACAVCSCWSSFFFSFLFFSSPVSPS